MDSDERDRLAALRAHHILDTLPEREFDEIVALASAICEMPISLVSLVDDERQWFKAAVGLKAKETPRSASFCAHAMLGDELFVVEDARKDPRFVDNPLVLEDPSIRFYAGAPLHSDSGLGLGALCIIDRVPRVLTPLQRLTLTTLGRQVEQQLRLRLALIELEAQHTALKRLEREKAQLTALIVHDLKGPLAAIMPTTEFLLETNALGPTEREAVGDIASSAAFMHRMVLDILDVGRADEGQLRARPSWVDLGALLKVIEKGISRRVTNEGRQLIVQLSGAPTYRTDADLIRRLVENLIDNALKYTPKGSDITVSLETPAPNKLTLRVRDLGAGIPHDQRQRIFEKYAQLEPNSPEAKTSRGLGLAFCKLAATALDGDIWVEPNQPRGSCFTVALG